MKVLRVLGLLSVGLSFVMGLWAVFNLPDRVPIHFNVHGEPDAYGSRYYVLLFPFVILGTYLLLTYLPKLDPYGHKVRERMETVRLVRDVIGVFLTLLYVIVLWATFKGGFPSWAFGVLFGLLFVILGNYLPKLPHNWFLGIRTPWTLASEKVWRKTHRVFGVVFFLLGILLILLSFTRPDLILLVLAVGTLVAVAGAIAHSYLLYARERRE